MDERTGLPVIGLVAAGPLTRMTSAAAHALGLGLRILAPPSWQGLQLPALLEFAAGCDVLTSDQDDAALWRLLAGAAAEGTRVFPAPDSLRRLRDRNALLARLGELGIPTRSDRAADAVRSGRRLVGVVARSPFGQVAAYPIAEALLEGGLLREMTVPAPRLTDEQAVAAGQAVIEVVTGLGLVGVFTVTLSLHRNTKAAVPFGDVAVTDVRMGPSPAGNWTLDGARTSQYEQRLRAVLDYPLGEVSLAATQVVTRYVSGDLGSSAMTLDERLHHCFAADPAARIHLYGMRPAPDRMIGHVTVLGAELAEARARAARAARWLQEGHDG